MSGDLVEDPTRVVAIGASAGGLEPLEQFFANTPTNTGFAFVVVQHLSPDFKSLMGEILARRTSMPIRVVEDETPIEPNVIYLMPPRSEMRLQAGTLRLVDHPASDGLNLPVDIFFESMAAEYGSKAIGVVLSGSGSDGSRGVKAIHQAGGLVIAQDVMTAKFDGMPSSALRSGAVNLVAGPAEIPTMLLEHLKRPFAASTSPDHDFSDSDSEMASIFARLLDLYRIDFSHYKVGTVGRRLAQRMDLLGITSKYEYSRRLEVDPAEVNALYRNLLIGVTSFFRDPHAFEALGAKALTKILETKATGDHLRVWVAGCASGEEAYSVAMLAQEQIEAAGLDLELRVLATDVHPDSVKFASRGLYPVSAVEAVDPERLSRFFTREGDDYRVTQELRKKVVFSQHDVLRDTPFSRMDLVCCRNLLIYMTPYAQSRVLDRLAFALRQDGILFLGPSESLGAHESKFEVLDSRQRMYIKRDDAPPEVASTFTGPSSLAAFGTTHTPPVQASNSSGPAPRLMRAYDTLLAQAMPPSVLVDEKHDVVHIFGSMARFMRRPSGRMTNSIQRMVSEEVASTLSVALHRCAHELRSIEFKAMRFDDGGGSDPEEALTGTLRVDPVPDATTDLTYFLVQFIVDQDGEPGADGPLTLTSITPSIDVVEALETELQLTRERLQATVEELQTSNEEMQATNEELVASNEELQSTNEELQSVNEELHTVNAEHQRKIEELVELSADMDNLLASTEVGVLFLDRSLGIRQFTPTAGDFFRLRPHDVGRPIADITSNLNVDLVGLFAGVLETEETREIQVSNSRGVPFLLRALPYRSASHRIDGVVAAFIEIAQLHEARSMLDAAAKRLAAVFEAAPVGLLTVDRSGTITELNPALVEMFGYQRAEIVGQPLDHLFPDDEGDRSVESSSGSDGDGLDDRYLRGRRADGTQIPVLVERRAIGSGPDVDDLVVVVDATDQARAAELRRELLDVAFAASDNDLAPEDGFESALRGFALHARLAVGADRADVVYVSPAGNPPVVSTSFVGSSDRASGLAEGWQTAWDLVADIGGPASGGGWLACPVTDPGGERLGIVVLQGPHDTEFTERNADVLQHTTRLMSPAFALQHSYEQVDQIVAERTEALAQTNAALSERNLRLDEFAHAVSHDLKAPLRHVAFNADIVIDELGDSIPEGASLGLGRIRMSIEHMRSMVDGLLDLADVTGNTTAEHRVDLATLVHEVSTLFSAELDAVGGIVECGDLPEVAGDPVLLTQLFQNLIDNAIKYGPSSGLVVRVGSRRHAEQPDRAVIVVSDNGSGIDPARASDIFRPFRRLDPDGPVPGTGIGLSLSKRIVERHGGQIWAEASEGEGVKIAFGLPLADGRAG